MGRHQEAVEESARARELDPMSLPVNLTRAMVLCFARQYRLAIEELESLLELESDSAATHYSLAFAHMYRRNFLRALTAFRKAAELLGYRPETSLDEGIRRAVAWSQEWASAHPAGDDARAGSGEGATHAATLGYKYDPDLISPYRAAPDPGIEE